MVSLMNVGWSGTLLKLTSSKKVSYKLNGIVITCWLAGHFLHSGMLRRNSCFFMAVCAQFLLRCFAILSRSLYFVPFPYQAVASEPRHIPNPDRLVFFPLSLLCFRSCKHIKAKFIQILNYPIESAVPFCYSYSTQSPKFGIHTSLLCELFSRWSEYNQIKICST